MRDFIRLKVYLYAFMILLLSGCADYDQEASEWGLSNVVFRQEFVLHDDSRIIEISFVPPETSGEYEIRLFFPDLDFERNTPEFSRSKNQILESLEGFSYRISANERSISSAEIDYSEGLANYSFNENEPLSLWLEVDVFLEGGTHYEGVLQIPTGGGRDLYGDRVVFVVGMGYSPLP